MNSVDHKKVYPKVEDEKDFKTVDSKGMSNAKQQKRHMTYQDKG